MTNPFDPRNNPAFAALNDDARKSVVSAFDAMSAWRNDMSKMSERNSEAVFDKMSAAAKAMGWQTEFVDMSRQQMQNASKMQVQFMDQVMETWEQQLKNPGSAFTMPGSSAGNLFPFPNAIPGMGGQSPFNMMPGMMPGMMPNLLPGMGSMPANPFQFWMQAADMWQKSCQQAMQSWSETQSNMMGGTGSSTGSGSGPSSGNDKRR